ncbi:polynucleotide 3'-phosphatase ZDP isoform X1 [Spinacia oleracea]|uniref:Polynucleotide 3'-phosphatase ZDP isoform X1 n=1 Tax=Spinacia oleracea TaxID=3562 RepID=A0ABM3RW48_SPIOL|nr:polynucleotide 3'-phosphatase ZDP isoform X1 [Spinacia oleracea]XP_056699854.1 polynucleotide 3'-phosphatase ZDP isoform X1 [Spinacia oleracea]
MAATARGEGAEMVDEDGESVRVEKSDDQEEIKKLVEELGKVKDDDDAAAGEEQEITEKRKHTDSDDVVDVGDKQGSSKKLLLSVSEDAKVEIVLVASDIMDIYQGATLLPKWKAFHTIIFLEKDDGLQDSTKIAAFDFDGCLANTDVRKTGADAWSLMYPSIPEKLQKLYNDGYKLVIFTNESNINRWKNKRQKAVDSKVGRLNNFINLVKVPIQVYIACGFGPKDPYRKPKTGMWHVMEQHFNSGISVDMDQSFYVGDAAGREQDHSDADIKFAQSVGLKFYVPEEFFTI